MRKPELVSAIADKAELSKEKAAEALNVILEQITDALEREETINLVGFGSFSQRTRKARQGKNPQTGEAMHIPASNTVAFKPGKTLKEAVNR